MIACDPKYLHSPAAPDFSGWPTDVPSLAEQLKRHGMAVVLAASLQPVDAYDATGQLWMHRAKRAEAQGRDAVKAAELLIRMYEQKLTLANEGR